MTIEAQTFMSNPHFEEHICKLLWLTHIVKSYMQLLWLTHIVKYIYANFYN